MRDLSDDDSRFVERYAITILVALLAIAGAVTINCAQARVFDRILSVLK